MLKDADRGADDADALGARFKRNLPGLMMHATNEATNYLGMIAGYAELLLQPPDPSELPMLIEWFGSITLLRAESLKESVQAMRDAATWDAAAADAPAPEPFDLRAFLESELEREWQAEVRRDELRRRFDEADPTAAARPVVARTLAAAIPSDLPMVHGDAAKARQLLGLLVKLAVRGHQKGALRVVGRHDAEHVSIYWLVAGFPESLRHLYRHISAAGQEGEEFGAYVPFFESFALQYSCLLARLLGGRVELDDLDPATQRLRLTLPRV